MAVNARLYQLVPQRLPYAQASILFMGQSAGKVIADLDQSGRINRVVIQITKKIKKFQ